MFGCSFWLANHGMKKRWHGLKLPRAARRSSTDTGNLASILRSALADNRDFSLQGLSETWV